jgi:hypothetical protein
VLYAFPTYNDEKGNTPRGIIRSLISQLCSTDTALTAMLVSECDRKNGTTERWTYVQWKDQLQKLIEMVGDEPCYILLDGLDECDERHRSSLLNDMVALATRCPSVHVLISSRPEADIEKCLTNIGEKVAVDENNREDILVYIKKELGQRDFCMRVNDSANHTIEHFIKGLPGDIVRMSRGLNSGWLASLALVNSYQAFSSLLGLF